VDWARLIGVRTASVPSAINRTLSVFVISFFLKSRCRHLP
jgi:hypothetical protein